MLTTPSAAGRTKPYQIAPRQYAQTVGKEDPRYHDLRWFAAPAEGQTWVEARFEQIEAIEARKAGNKRQIQQQAPAAPDRETIPSQIIAPEGGAPRAQTVEREDPGRWPEALPTHENKHDGLASLSSGLRQAFPDLIPAKPYCADFLDDGLCIRSRPTALRRRHIQLNGPSTFVWMLHDIDGPGAYYAHDDANVPQPNVIMVNPENGHAHSAYLLSAPVARHSASRVGPLRYFGAVERGIARRVGADRHYAGLIAKNPLHVDWKVEWRREQPYALTELAGSLFDSDMAPDRSAHTTLGAGRNVTVFDELRSFAYCEVLKFKRDDAGIVGLDAFRARLEAVALGINTQFPEALNLTEVRAIAKSVAKWTWAHFSEAAFSRLQSLRVQRRWAGHVAASTTKPWESMGISRATYYRRRAKQEIKNASA